MLLMIFALAAIVGISQGGVSNGRIFRKGGYEVRNPYLMGGHIVSERSYPSMVSVRYNNNHVCGGVILTEYWILTAAQCLENRSPSSITAVVGSNDLNYGNTHTVNKMKLHEEYNPTDSWRNDIALLQVREPITFNWDIRPAKLPTQGETIDANDIGVVLGWGSLEAGGELSSMLRRLNETIWVKTDCNNAYNPLDLNIYFEQFCAGGSGGEGTCDGDMGGPLILNDQVIGIVSWGKPCGYSGYPTVYTKVPEFIDWIKFYLNEM